MRDYFATRGLVIAIAAVGVARRLRCEPRTRRVLIQRTVIVDRLIARLVVFATQERAASAQGTHIRSTTTGTV